MNDAERRYLNMLGRRIVRELRRIDRLGSLSAARVFPSEERALVNQLEAVLERQAELRALIETDCLLLEAESLRRDAFRDGRIVFDNRTRRVERSAAVVALVDAVGDDDLEGFGPDAELKQLAARRGSSANTEA